MGSNTMISLGAKMDVRRGKIIVGNNTTITHGTVVLSHDAGATLLRKTDEATTIIGDNVFIGVNSVILPGVVIGDNCVIGAGSVVTKSVPPNSLALGNPARVVRNLPG